MSSEGVVCSKKFLTKFIEIYKEHAALWKIKSKEYSKKNLKNKAYSALIEYCKLFYPNADRNFVSKKIQNLRGFFRKELKKVEASQRSAASVDDLYEPHLWYFDLLLFTTDQEMPVKSIDSENFENESQCSDLMENENAEVEEAANKKIEDFLESNSQVDETTNSVEETHDVPINNSQRGFKEPTTTRQVKLQTSNNEKRKRKYGFQQQHEEFMKTCTEEVLRQKETVHEFQAVGINIASKLQKMNPTQQVLAEGLINKILMKGIFNELTRSTDVLDGSVRPNSYLYGQSSNSSTVTPSPDSDVTLFYTNIGQSLEHQPF